jgi:uncharacterized iron-regulated membrane protein
MKVNHLIFQIHKWSGFLIAVVIILIALTGSLLVFLDEIDEDLSPEIKFVSPLPQKLPIDKIIASVRAKQPEVVVKGINVGRNLDRAFEIELELNHQRYTAQVNPYTAEVLDISPSRFYLVNFIYSIHTSLLIPPWGDLLVALTAWLFTVSSVTGLWVQRKFLFRVFRIGIRRNKSTKTAYSDLHKLTGTLSILTNVILGATGIYISLYAFDPKFLKNEKHLHTKLSFPLPYSLDSLVNHSSSEIAGFEPDYISFQRDEKQEIVVYGKIPYGNSLYTPKYSSASLAYHVTNGRLIEKSDLRKKGFWEQFSAFGHEFHYGKYAGLTSRIIYFLGGLLPVVLAISGMVIWWKKSQKSRKPTSLISKV